MTTGLRVGEVVHGNGVGVAAEIGIEEGTAVRRWIEEAVRDGGVGAEVEEDLRKDVLGKDHHLSTK